MPSSQANRACAAPTLDRNVLSSKIRKSVIQNGWFSRSSCCTLEDDHDETSCGPWSEFEDECLFQGAKICDGSNWENISRYVPGRNAKQCRDRYNNFVDTPVTGLWSVQEDECLLQAIQIHGIRKWKRVAEHVQGRNGKQCRERYHNQLDPNLNKDRFTASEDAIILREYNKVGPRWSYIARLLSNRSDNDIKNRAAVTFLPKRECRNVATNAIPLQQTATKPRKNTKTQRTLTVNVDDAVKNSKNEHEPTHTHFAPTNMDVPTVQLDNSVENVDFFSAMVELGALPHSTQTVTWEPPSPDSLEAHLLSHTHCDPPSQPPLKHINLDDLDGSNGLNNWQTPPYESTKEFCVNVRSNPGEKTRALPLFSTSILPVGCEPEGELFMMEHKCMAINRLINNPRALSGLFLDSHVPKLIFNEGVVVHVT